MSKIYCLDFQNSRFPYHVRSFYNNKNIFNCNTLKGCRRTIQLSLDVNVKFLSLDNDYFYGVTLSEALEAREVPLAERLHWASPRCEHM